MSSSIPNYKIMNTCEALKRYQRCVKIGNPVTIKLAKRDLMQYIPRMTPLDLVNAVKHFPKDEVGSVTAREILKRNFAKFNSKDFAVLVHSLISLPSDTRDEILIALKPLLPSQIPVMRPSDICVTLWALTKLDAHGSDMQQLVDLGVSIFTQNNFSRVRILNNINITQLLFAFSKTAKPGEKTIAFFGEILQLLIKPGFASKIQDNSLAFYIYAVVNISQSIEFDMKSPLRRSFFESMKSEVKRRKSLSPIQLFDCIRGLGRAGFCDQELVTAFLVPSMAEEGLQLKPEQSESIKNILKQFKHSLVAS